MGSTQCGRVERPPEAGQVKVNFIPAEQRPYCTVCSAEFWCLRHQWYCYACGEIICYSCIKRWRRLPRLGYPDNPDAVKPVCGSCDRKQRERNAQLHDDGLGAPLAAEGGMILDAVEIGQTEYVPTEYAPTYAGSPPPLLQRLRDSGGSIAFADFPQQWSARLSPGHSAWPGRSAGIKHSGGSQWVRRPLYTPGGPVIAREDPNPGGDSSPPLGGHYYAPHPPEAERPSAPHAGLTASSRRSGLSNGPPPLAPAISSDRERRGPLTSEHRSGGGSSTLELSRSPGYSSPISSQ
eukprot:TRINITY_DN3411_c5_g1_i1.p1 TRINITY_DN3411_c5_g1~~TRINITY_DN3411_c5_g1_i1.p1  ORF type:complete len:293 (+),score=35.54 TRINITY_DN3411_c5_g1_i1:95-973(+)